MGRKIPGRKHHGVRDPEKQRAERWKSIKDKVNAPPVNPDDQHVPKSLSRIMELKDKVKSGLYGNKKKNKDRLVESVDETHGKKRKFEGTYEKPIPEFKQRKGENDKAFMYRVNRVCENVKNEAAFEDKYGVQVRRNKDTGKVEDVVKRPKDELELLIKKAKKATKDKGKKKKKKKNENKEPKLTKSQKWQIKKTDKKQKKKAAHEGLDFDSYKDTVQFGEIVHEPPSLVAPRKVEKTGEAPRPGRKELLLKSMLNVDKTSGGIVHKDKGLSKNRDAVKKVSHKVIDKKGKRKDLPNALRRQLDKQQQEIIDAYKALKKKKYGSN